MQLALVTGTSRGIGAAVARSFVDRGWQVRGLARGPAALEHAAYEHDAVDLADLAAVEAWVDRRANARDLAGCARVALVNNAALLEPMRPLARVGLAELERALRVNLVVATWLMGAIAARRPSGVLRIVNLSSGAATKAYPSWGAYCASKAGLRMAGQVLAREHETAGRSERDLAVVDYAPGVVATTMQESIRSASEEDFPLRRRFVDLWRQGELVAPEGPAEEIAELCTTAALPVWSERRFQP